MAEVRRSIRTCFQSVSGTIGVFAAVANGCFALHEVALFVVCVRWRFGRAKPEAARNTANHSNEPGHISSIFRVRVFLGPK